MINKIYNYSIKQVTIQRTFEGRFRHDYLMADLSKRFSVALLAFLTLAMLTHSIRSQDVQPRVVAGSGVSAATQSTLGLVTINGGCSGTLLNQFWVLTARHCVTVGNEIPNDLQSPSQVRITAAWTAKTAIASRIYDFNVNSAAGSARDRDIVLVYLGSDNFGETRSQKIFTAYRDGKLSGRLKDTDTVTQYGRGFSTFAIDSKTPSAGAGTYRSAVFNPSAISATHYNLIMNTGNQSGHGGDSGGPTVVTVNGQPNGGIAGVQSTCNSTGSVPGKPADDWSWATGISLCTYVSTEPFLTEISKVIKEAPLSPPFITASQPVIIRPFETFAYVWFQWDSGAGHPNAEVWVSINNSAEIPAINGLQNGVFKLAKAGPAELKLPRYRHYKFVLKDAGTILSTVSFTVQ